MEHYIKGLHGRKATPVQESYKRIKQAQTLAGYAKDLHTLLTEPTKGNAIRIISKKVLTYLFKVGGMPGTMLHKLYGKMLDHFIEALFFYDKEITIKDQIELLIKNGTQAKQNVETGVGDLVKAHAFLKTNYMPTVWQYCFLLAMQDPHYNGQYPRNLELKLIEITKKRIKAFDAEIVYFLAIDNFVRAIPSIIEKVKKELTKPSNTIEQAIRTMNLHALELITLDIALLNFKAGVGGKVDKYIKLRNEWALWINHAPMTRANYEEAPLPEINLE